MRRDPIEPGENARERTHKTRHIIGDDWHIKSGKSCRIAIGAQHKACALVAQRRDHMGEKGNSAGLSQRLVAAAHPASEPAREKDANTRSGPHRIPRLSTCCLPRAPLACRMLGSSMSLRTYTRPQRLDPARVRR